MTAIEVDLELHKAIEAHRISLNEGQSDIVRRVFGIYPAGEALPIDKAVSPHGKVRLSRRGGEYAFEIFGERNVSHSLKDVLRVVILNLEKARPGAIDRLSQYRTPKGRRIVAKRSVEIYPGNPELAENCAENLGNGWWFDTNISKKQLKVYVKNIIQWCNFSEDDVKLGF